MVSSPEDIVRGTIQFVFLCFKYYQLKHLHTWLVPLWILLEELSNLFFFVLSTIN